VPRYALTSFNSNSERLVNGVREKRLTVNLPIRNLTTFDSESPVPSTKVHIHIMYTQIHIHKYTYTVMGEWSKVRKVNVDLYNASSQTASNMLLLPVLWC